MPALLFDFFTTDSGFQISRRTYGIIQAASWDAGNRAMRAGDRTRWNEDDWNVAVQEFDRLIAELKAVRKESI